MSTPAKVTRDKVVTLQYSLATADGTVIRSASSRPIQYLQGSGGLFPKLETALENRKVGDVLTVRLLPDDAFGKRDPELVIDVPRGNLPPGERLEIGGRILGTDPDGTEHPFIVRELGEDSVSLDGNHPLAGQTLIFEIEIQGVRDATAQELQEGKAAE
jgi:FKBP-type peptidyl-prolyl cis-trans isomerase SlyD